MRKQDGTMKNTYEFLSDLHKSWGSLNKEQKTAIALQMGGKNQMEVFMATMDNFDTAIEATNTAMDAQGSASEENAKAIESLQGHLQDLKRAWEEFSYTMVKSDMLKKGMDILTGALEFLSSDTGQAVIKLAAIATGLNLIAKAAMGLKGLSLVKSFVGIGKATKEVKNAGGVMKALSKHTGTLASSFGRLGTALFGGAGLIVGIGLLSVALAKYVDIGKEAQANKADKNFKKTSDEVDKLSGKLEKNRKEWSELREKQRSGEDLTEAEEARLRELEAQTRELKRQLEIKQALLGKEAKEKWTSTSPKQLEGAAKDKYTQSRTTQGQTEQQALAGLGITAKSNRLDVAMVNYAESAKEAAKAENEWKQAIKETDKAKKEFGNNSEEYYEAAEKESKAYDRQAKAQKESGKFLDQLKTKRDQMYKEFGGKEIFDKNAPKTLKKSRDQLDKMIKATGDIDKLQKGTGNVTKAFKSLNKAT